MRFKSARTKRLFGKAQRRGVVTVELALTVGLLFFFFFAAFEFCRVTMIRHTIENAVYEGARKAVPPGGSADDVRQEVRKILRTVGVRSSRIAVDPEVIALGTPRVSVTVEVPIDGNLYLPAMFFKNRTLIRGITMQRETMSNSR